MTERRDAPDGDGSPARRTITQPLTGVRVLDLSRVLAGPFCGQLLADLGADVIKVEAPAGDDARTFGPHHEGQSTYFRLLNRNKRGVVLDLKTDDGRRGLEELLEGADVLVENFRPGVMDRLGFGVASSRERYPRLIVVSITGFGQSGPLAALPAYDLIAQAMSGLVDATGHPGGPPTRSAVSLGDLIPGLYGALGAMAALQHRERTGQGQHVDVAMFDCLVSLLESLAMRALYTDESLDRLGNEHALSAPIGTFATSDQPVVIAIANDALFVRFADVMGHPEWPADERFATDALRAVHRHALRKELERVTSTLSSADLLERLQGAGIPCGPLLDVRAALQHEQTIARGMVIEESDGFRTLGRALKFSEAPFDRPRPAPAMGADNDALLRGSQEAEHAA